MGFQGKSNFYIFRIFLLVRIVSVFLVQTFYEADEYWQSLEVAHKLIFGYGYLTWEWEKGIRSYFFPLIFGTLYKILQLLGLDTPVLLIFLPRIFQAVLSAYSDLCLYQWCGQKKWTAFLVTTSWFYFYMGSRTLINTFETSINTIALSMFPWCSKYKEEKSNFLWLVGLICIVRPTAALMWLPLCLYHFMITKYSWSYVIFYGYLPVGCSLLTISILVDSLASGSFTVSFYEFLEFNVFQKVASFYGTHPWHWYMSTGLPAVLGINKLPFIFGTFMVLKNRSNRKNELAMLGTLVFAITILSFLPHKEFRFLMPFLPLIFYITSRFLSDWSQKAKDLYVWIVVIVIFFANAIPAYYLCMIHQRGSLDVMTDLREIAQKNPNNTHFLFLMPCHSTPMYSHLHVNVTTRFLTCNPNLNNTDNYMDEATQFYNNPNGWLRQHYPPNGTLPTHIIMYNNLVPSISDILSRYKPILEVFHTYIPVSSQIGNSIIVQELQF